MLIEITWQVFLHPKPSQLILAGIVHQGILCHSLSPGSDPSVRLSRVAWMWSGSYMRVQTHRYVLLVAQWTRRLCRVTSAPQLISAGIVQGVILRHSLRPGSVPSVRLSRMAWMWSGAYMRVQTHRGVLQVAQWTRRLCRVTSAPQLILAGKVQEGIKRFSLSRAVFPLWGCQESSMRTGAYMRVQTHICVLLVSWWTRGLWGIHFVSDRHICTSFIAFPIQLEKVNEISL